MRILLLLFLLSSQILVAQERYTITGFCKDSINADIAYLYVPERSNYKVDSCRIQNNRFEFKGSVEYPVMSTLELKGNKNINGTRNSITSINFYVENSSIEIILSSENTVVLNSNTQNLQDEFMKSLECIQIKMDSIKLEYNQRYQLQNITKQFEDSINNEYEIINKMNSEALVLFISNHPQDFFSLYLLETLIDNVPDNPNLLDLYNKLSIEIRHSWLGETVSSKLDKIKKTSLGSDAPDFSLTDLNGKRFKLSDFKGKYVLLLFWSSDCPHCIDEIANLKEIYNEFGGDKFTIIAIAQDNISRRKDWLNFVKTNNLKWINAFDERIDGKKKIAMLYNVKYIPSNFILNPKGEIIKKDISGDTLIKIMNSIFKIKM